MTKTLLAGARPALLLSLLGLVACAGEPAPPAAGAAAASPVASAGPAAPLSAAPLSDASIYQFDAPWITDAEETVTLADLRGGPVALAMVYVDCGTACPMIVHDMKTLGARAEADGLRYVLVSLDPERDTPERLRAFRQMHGLGEEWTLLNGSAEDVQTLAALLNVRYRPETNGTIAHSNLITLLDAGGEPVARQEGLGTDPAPAVAALRTALALNS